MDIISCPCYANCDRWPHLQGKWHWLLPKWLTSPAAMDVDKKDFYKNLNMDYLNMDEDNSISKSFSLDGFSEEENQDEKITAVLDEWIKDMV